MKVKNITLLIPLFLYHYTHTNFNEIFWTDIYHKATDAFWGKTESVSGPGSTAEQTYKIREQLESILKKYAINSFLDIPCGDFNWMQLVNFGQCSYIGCDVVKPLIDANNTKYGSSNKVFLHIDATKDPLPKADIILCRDLLVHLSLTDILLILKNFKKSGAKYLLTTAFTKIRPDTNDDIASGGWRTVNLQMAPFNFPKPLLIINEHCTEQEGTYSDKSLGLWLLDDINI
jgi:SAM-dependent methyltransferase